MKAGWEPPFTKGSPASDEKRSFLWWCLYCPLGNSCPRGFAGLGRGWGWGGISYVSSRQREAEGRPASLALASPLSVLLCY